MVLKTLRKFFYGKKIKLQNKFQPTGSTIVFFNSLPNDNILDWSKVKAFADHNINVTKILKFVLGNGRKHSGKRRKCWLPAFSPFPTMFSKDFFFRVVKSQDCLV